MGGDGDDGVLMRALLGLMLLPILVLAYVAAWVGHPRRRLAGSAVLAGLAVGRAATGVAW